MSMKYFSADFLYSENQLLANHYLAIEDGIIREVAPLEELDPALMRYVHGFPDSAIIPGFVNSHNHSFQSLLKGFADDTDFFTWRDQALYRYSEIITEDDLYHGALFAFAEMLKNGITTVCDFFYINDQDNRNAEVIIKAANDLGIRIVLARTMYDWSGAPKRYQETVEQAVSNTESLIKIFRDNSMVSIIPAPHSLHAATVPMIEAGADLARKYNTLFHMHIVEGQYERQMTEERYGMSPIRFLNHLGVLDERLVGIHCVWLDDEEIDLMGQNRVKVSYNPSSNMFLGDGITRIKELLNKGVSISLGTDGGCSNNRASIVEEMRMTNLLQKVRLLDSSQLTAEDAFLMGTSNGGVNLGQLIGKLATGYAADFVVLNLNDLSLQPRHNFRKNIVYSMMPSAFVASYVAGEPVMREGKLLRIPEEEIVGRIRKTMHSWYQTFQAVT